jgi:hypothetical protein
VPIVPDYLYRLQQAAVTADDTFKFLSKNCSNVEILRRRSYFVRHPAQFRRILRATCNWTVDWALNKTETENKQRTVILEEVKKML